MRSLKGLVVLALLSLFTLPGTALAGRIFDSSPRTIVKVVAQVDSYNIGYVVVTDLRGDGPCNGNLIFVGGPASLTPAARNSFELLLAAQIVSRQLTDLVYDYDSSTGNCTLLRVGIL